MARSEEPPLYATEAQIARKVFGPSEGHMDFWRALSAVLKKQGLPPQDPLTGRRYWPAVRAFLDNRAGLHDFQQSHSDGMENFDEAPARSRYARAKGSTSRQW